MKEIWVVQPYVPDYRVPFFESLTSQLELDGIQLRVASGSPTGPQRDRGDDAQPEWLVQRTARRVSVLGRTLDLTLTRRYWRGAAGVILPLMGSSVDAVAAMTFAGKLGYWGHVANYTSSPHWLDVAIERQMLRRADQVFAYTPSGAHHALRSGVPADKVTTVMNSIDTATLVRSMHEINEVQLQHFRERHQVPPNRPILAYIGGLDDSKRVDLLVEALEVLSRAASNVHVVVAGAGTQLNLLHAARDRGQVSLVGNVTGHDKACLLKLSRAIVNPGRVGLIAVDALASGKTLLTTDWKFHAPEIEYLTKDQSLRISASDPHEFARLMDEASLIETRDAAWAYPTLEQMVDRFAAGVRRMIA